MRTSVEVVIGYYGSNNGLTKSLHAAMIYFDFASDELLAVGSIVISMTSIVNSITSGNNDGQSGGTFWGRTLVYMLECTAHV